VQHDTVIVVAGGPAPPRLPGNLPGDAYVIAADSGLDHAYALGLGVDLEAERGGAIETAVGRDHGASVGHGDVGARPRCDDHDVRLDHAFLRWHYPGQVLRVGGAVAALSARLPELPGSLCRY